jgi:hypothetical protein
MVSPTKKQSLRWVKWPWMIKTVNKKDKKVLAPMLLTSRYFDFESPIEENPKDFKGYTFSKKH